MSPDSQHGLLRAITTEDGTAAAETALCRDCDSPAHRARLEIEADSDVLPGRWLDCSENPFLTCQVCGRNGEELRRSRVQPGRLPQQTSR
jgi:hypothetical protein